MNIIKKSENEMRRGREGGELGLYRDVSLERECEKMCNFSH